MTFTWVLPVLFLMGCKAIPTVTSLPFQETKNEEYRYYDAKSKVRYAVWHDDKNLYLHLNTMDRSSIQKIIRNGLSIYFDESGKKNTAVCLQYPMPLKGQPPMRSSKNLKEQGGKHSRLQEQINGLSKTATFRKFEQSETIQVSMESDIQVSIVAENKEELTYRLRVPLQRIHQPNSVLFLGIESGKLEMRQSPGMQGLGAEGRGGGGQGGGRPGGGQRGERPGGRAGAQGQGAMATPIQFWIQVEGLGA